MTNMQKNMTNMQCGSIMENIQENMQKYAKSADHPKNKQNMHSPPCWWLLPTAAGRAAAFMQIYM